MDNRFSKVWIKDIIKESFDSEPINSFIEYVNSFYGRDGIYRLMKNGKWATVSDITVAIGATTFNLDEGTFCGDSIDREAVRWTLEEMGFAEDSQTVRHYSETTGATICHS